MLSLRWNLWIVLLIIILIFLQYRLWFASGGLVDIQKLKKTVELQVAENEQLKKRNEALLFQIHRLQNSQDATESRARNELGMIKKGETFYQVVK